MAVEDLHLYGNPLPSVASPLNVSGAEACRNLLDLLVTELGQEEEDAGTAALARVMAARPKLGHLVSKKGERVGA